MKVIRTHSLVGRTTNLRFSKAERATLRQASEIAAEARRRAREVSATWFELDGVDLTLAHVEHDANDLAEAGEVEIEWRRA